MDGLTMMAYTIVGSKDRQAIEKIENGKVNTTLYTLYEIAKGLEVGLEELVSMRFS